MVTHKSSGMRRLKGKQIEVYKQISIEIEREIFDIIEALIPLVEGLDVDGADLFGPAGAE